MRPSWKIASCVLVQLGLATAGVGCVDGSATDVADNRDEATAATAQPFIGAPPDVDLYAVCPGVPPASPLWPVCQELYAGDYGDYGGYGGYGGFGGHGYGHGHFGGGGWHGGGGSHFGGGHAGGGGGWHGGGGHR